MNILQHKIDAKVAEISLMEENLAVLEKSFSELTAANRVVKHLKRIFNKKYRPQLSMKDNEEGKIFCNSEILKILILLVDKKLTCENKE